MRLRHSQAMSIYLVLYTCPTLSPQTTFLMYKKGIRITLHFKSQNCICEKNKTIHNTHTALTKKKKKI